jgi:hypothetical protein
MEKTNKKTRIQGKEGTENYGALALSGGGTLRTIISTIIRRSCHPHFQYTGSRAERKSDY